MSIRIFLAGATGVIGRRLVPLLLEQGHLVTGTTRSAGKAAMLREMGVVPAVVDVFEAAALRAAVVAAAPEIVIHQLTDLPAGLDPATMDAARLRNARLREIGTRHLVEAALAAGARRIVAQSITFLYAPLEEARAWRESDPLDLAATGIRAASVKGIAALEASVLQTPGIEGIVLRYGQLYGTGTGAEAPAGNAPVHVDAAAQAALLALTRGTPGLYNIAEEAGAVDSTKARRDLGWDAGFRLTQG
ncbi:MAG: NAD-dependent epimerase/dehydratase family protein [Dongiaceae bacterium]